MDNFLQTPIQLILFFILYGVTGAMPLLAALYLLLRRGNAFAPDITPPVRLRRWAASFFAVSALGHVWWLLFYVYSRNYYSMEDAVHSVGYVAIVVFDCVTVQFAVMVAAIALVIYFFGYDDESRADPELSQAFLFIFAAIAVFVAVMLYVPHRINVKHYNKIR